LLELLALPVLSNSLTACRRAIWGFVRQAPTQSRQRGFSDRL